VREMDSTAPMLGVFAPQDFGVDDVSTTLEPGDTLVAYTDGVFEARDRKGRKWGLGRLRDAMKRQPPPPRWPDFLLTLVEGFTNGSLDDDLLVASLTYIKKPAPVVVNPARPVQEPAVVSL
jgi:serine phosphatase RsbU (regulator of sigma subunit)